MNEKLKRYIEDARRMFGVELKADTIEGAREELRSKVPQAESAISISARELEAPSTVSEKDRTVECVIASEYPVERWTWYDGRIEEILLMDGMDMGGRAEHGIPLLDSHNHWSTKSVLGTTDNLRVEGDKLIGTRHFSSQAEREFRMVQEGHLRNQSIGYTINGSVRVDPGKSVNVNGRELRNDNKDTVIRYVTSWTPLEDSIVSIPADPTCGMRMYLPYTMGQPTNQEGARTMPQINTPQNKGNNESVRTATEPEAPVTPVTPEVDTDAVRSAGADAEFARQNEIRAMCAGVNVSQEFTDGLIQGRKSVDDARKAVLEEIARQNAERSQTPPAGKGHITMGDNPFDKVREGMVDALIVRANGNILKPESVSKDARDWGSMSMLDSARWFLEQSGQRMGYNVPANEVFERAISTSDFPKLLKSTAERSLWAGWGDTEKFTYKQWTGEAKAKDFREQEAVRVLGRFNVEEVKEGGEYTYETLGEEGMKYKVAKFGKMIAFTYEAMVNDDLDQLTVYPAEFGRACSRLENELAYNYLLNNPAWADGHNLFDASNHGNQAGSGSAPTEKALNEAFEAMAVQTDKVGTPLYVTPRFIIAPAGLKATIDKLLLSETLSDGNEASTRYNTVRNAVGTRIYEPMLDVAFKGHEQAWFVLGDSAHTVKIVHMNGAETPKMTTEYGFNVDGFRAKVRHIAGSYADSYQAFYKNPGVSKA